MDNVYLTGGSALAFLLSPRAKAFDADFEFAQNISRSSGNFMAYLKGEIDFAPLVSISREAPKITRHEASSFADELKCNLPLQINVSNLATRRNSRNLHSVVLPASVQQDAFFQVGEGLYCAVPELMLLTVAKEMADIELVVLMSLMFGVFTKDQESGKLIPRRSLSTPARVLSFIARCDQTGVRAMEGAARVKALVPQAVVRAASPKEIECALRLGRAVEQGGCGFGLPEMNYRLDIPSTKRSRYCDLYWPTQNVAVEYQGGEEHMGLEAVEADALHRNDLASIGVPVFNITAGQLRSITAFNHTAKQIERCLNGGKKRKYKPFPSSVAFHDAQRALKSEVDQAFARFGF